MASSMSTGDRRWASSTRRSGMTVLGKVAVPKPINLPSQRLENHGLDPNVEIVPKGTHSWGAKSSSQTNAWGSSSLSPRTDGGSGSPSHLSCHPSSGGSNMRPSTAGSDRPPEPVVNAWGPNSRPSSASGALSSNQSSLRPHSAETRPGSSPLSRFAEPFSENSVGISSSNNDGFSLTSGDFPTLGSEKEKTEKNVGLQSCDAHVTASSNSGATNTWRRDEHHFGKDDMPSEMRQEDVHSYPNASMPPHHYETWRGPPVNNPSGGVWYRGPPYGAPLPPGGFPMEPFPYYLPHFPANAIVNPQPVPPRGTGPRGHQPMSGDMHRPLMPDPYIRPGIPIRPGFCPGPVPYESYYRPPMGYCDRSEHDIPFMGLPRGPVYSKYPNQNAPTPANFHARSGGHAGKASTSEQMEADHFRDSVRPYKLLMKQQNRTDGHMLEDPVAVSIEKGDHRNNARGADWEVEIRKDEMVATPRAEQRETPKFSDRHTGSKSVSMHSSEKVGNKKLPDIKSTKKMEISASSLGVSQTTAGAPEDSSLIHKLDDSNANARVSDAQPEVISDSSREEQNTKSHIYPKAPIPANSGGTGSLPSEGFQSFGAHKPVTHRADFSSRRYAGKQNRTETTPAADSLGKISGLHLGTDAKEYSQEHRAAAEERERPATYSQKKHWGGPSRQMLDANDFRGQEHAKMRKSAEQLYTQQQNEGDQMTKQKAKACEKPKMLNTHAYGVQNSIQKLENISAGAIMNKKEESCTATETELIVGTLVCPNKASFSAPNTNVVAHVTINNTNKSERPKTSENVQEIRSKRAQKEAAAVQKQSLSFQMEVNSHDAGGRSNVPQNHENTASKNKRSGYKHKQNVPSESLLADNSLSSGNDVAPKCGAEEVDKVTASVEDTCDIAPISGSRVPAGQKEISESVAHQKRRSNWTGKGKQIVNEAPTTASLPSRKAQIRNTPVESEQVKSELVLSSVKSGTDSKDAKPSSEQHLHVPNEGNPDGINSQMKSQHPSRMPRNYQSNRSSGKFNNTDAVMWAPVRSQNRSQVTDDDSSQNRSEVTNGDRDRKTVCEAVVLSQRVDHHALTNPKSKRAEIERYVAKPIAKEVVQRASIQQLAPSHAQSPVGETDLGVESDPQSIEHTQPVGTTIKKGGPRIESRNGNGKHNNLGKAHGSSCPRSSESANTHGLHDGSSYSSKTSKYNSMKAKPDGALGKEQPQHYSDRSASDGRNIQHCPDSVAHANFVKDQGAITRGKRQFYRGHKGLVNSHDQEKNNNNEDGDNVEAHYSARDMIQTDFTSAKENCNVAEEPTSHWQPKPRGASYRRGAKSSRRDDIRTNKREYLSHSGELPQQQASQVIVEPHAGETVSQKSNEVPDQNKRENNPLFAGGCPHSSNQASADLTESISPATTDTRHEQLASSRRSIRSNRFSRGHNPTAEWSLPGQDYRQHNPSGNWERQRNHTNYQYKPVGSYNNKSHNNEGSKDGSQETDSKYVERAQNHSRRGRENLYGEQRTHIQVDAGCD